MKICFASQNADKIKEVQALMAPKFKLLGLSEFGETKELQETNHTFEGNALQKARYVFHTYGVPCFADDSGLEVDALDGAPGIHSAYYAGPERSHEANVALLLSNLKSKKSREARFKTAIAFVGKNVQKVFIGSAQGHIADKPRGRDGFAYDVLFVPKGYAKTYAELGTGTKNQISARAYALRQLITFLNNRFSTHNL